MSMPFYSLYYDLAELLNDTESDNLTRCKTWINYTLSDLCKMFQFEELIERVTTTAESYNFKRITPYTSSSVISLVSDATADVQTATVYGYTISSGTRTWATENVALSGTVTASTTTLFSVLDRIELATAASGNISISESSAVHGIILPGETKIANDHQRIIKIDANGDVLPIADRDRLLRFPNDASYDNKYYTLRGSTIYFYGITTGNRKTMYRYKQHPTLVNDYDESPLFVQVQDIVEAARLGWGVRFEDEQDGVMGKQIYKQKLGEIIADRVSSSDKLKMVRLNRRR